MAAVKIGEAVEEVTKQVAKTANRYEKLSEGAVKAATQNLEKSAAGLNSNAKFGSRLSDTGSWGLGNYREAANAEGRTALGMMGRHAVQGAAWGAVAGGTLEAAQGGSFWDGAKQGAFNGAALSVGVRGLKNMSGAKSYFSGEQNIAKSASRMWNSTGGSDAAISKQAVALLNQRQRDGLARSIMGANKKGS